MLKLSNLSKVPVVHIFNFVWSSSGNSKSLKRIIAPFSPRPAHIWPKFALKKNTREMQCASVFSCRRWLELRRSSMYVKRTVDSIDFWLRKYILVTDIAGGGNSTAGLSLLAFCVHVGLNASNACVARLLSIFCGSKANWAKLYRVVILIIFLLNKSKMMNRSSKIVEEFYFRPQFVNNTPPWVLTIQHSDYLCLQFKGWKTKFIEGIFE